LLEDDQIEIGRNIYFLSYLHWRYVLYHLRHAGIVDIDTLSALLANELEGPSTTAGGGKTPEHTKITLHHIHLPKLADAGLITVSQEEQSIELDEITAHGQFIDQAARIDGYAPPATSD